MSKTIRMIHADDHQIFREGLRQTMKVKYGKDIEFIAEANNGLELLEKVKKYRPEVVITDIKTPVMDGIDACLTIKRKFPSIPVIKFFSAMVNEIDILSILQAGAKGFLSKNSNIEEVKIGIQTVHERNTYYSSDIAEKVFALIQKKSLNFSNKPHFSLQEITVIKLLFKQFTSKEIAKKIQMSPRTVEDYRFQIQEKIGAKNVAGIILYAIINEIVKFGEV